MKTPKGIRKFGRYVALTILIPAITLFGVAPSHAAKLNPPTNIVPSAVSGSVTSISVNFTNSNNGTASSYTVYVYSSTDNYVAAVVTQTNYQKNTAITGLSANKTYKVRVQAIVDAGGRNTSSNLSALSTQSVTTGTTLATPSAPTVSATSNTLKSINVSWSTITNASSYTLKLYNSSGTLLTTSGLTGLSGTSATITTSNYSSLANSTTYKVSITAVGNGSSYFDSSESDKSDVTTNAVPVAPTITTQPTSQSSTYASTATFGVTATSTDSGTLGYQWQVSTNAGVSWANVSSGTGGTTSTYTTATLAMSANDYRYRVNVTNSKNGESSSAITSNAVALTVAKANQEALSPPVLSVTSAAYNGFAYSQALTVTSSGGGSGDGALSITGVSDGTASGCAFSSGILTASTVGTCTLTITKAEDTNYNAISTTTVFTFTRAISTDNNLGTLTILPGTISPAFSSSTSNYSLSISSTVTTVTVTAAPSSQYASFTVNGSAALSNTPFTVSVDTNSTNQVITIRVTAEDLSTRDYVISIVRVINDKTSTVVSPNVIPAPSTTTIQSTKQIIQTPTASILPRVTSISTASGPVGTVVTITGTGFSSLLSVKLNGVNMTPTNQTLITSTSITVTIPVGARSGTIAVTTSKGSGSTPRFTVTI